MPLSADNPPPIGPLWEVVFPLVYGRQHHAGFLVEGIAGTAFVPCDGVAISCAHCFGGLGEWDYALAKVEPGGTPIALLAEVDLHPDGFDLAMGRFSDSRFPPLPPFRIETAMIGAAVLAPGYPLPRRTRRSLSDPIEHEAIVRGLRGNVTQDGIVTGLGQYGALPSIELDMSAPGGLSGAPVFNWGLVNNPLSLVGVIRGVSVVSTMRDEPFVEPEGSDEEPERYTFGLATPAFALESLRGSATNGANLGALVEGRWPYLDAPYRRT
jgi:hypothetical protein